MSDSEHDEEQQMPIIPGAVAAPVRDETQISADEERADEYEETWLKMWNNVTNPKHVSCKTAFDILAWCFGPASQLRAVYRTGTTTMCTQQRLDLQLCIKVKAQALKDPEGAREALRADRLSKQDARPHVWKFRTQPPEQFRTLEQAGLTLNASDVYGASAAAAAKP